MLDDRQTGGLGALPHRADRCLSTGTTALYGTGLDFCSVFTRFSRVQVAILIGVLAISVLSGDHRLQPVRDRIRRRAMESRGGGS
ncbi:hypothetical protein [Streptomyces sp. M2CJ-2]|uniref:hypothetical protein n=1 Tax=Streptomyces sp. M2CJ-2 TaxID=2803948 RepID=UPI001F3821A7|nr:hypothetical protein [Streptomyces sp. M2CJ-2]